MMVSEPGFERVLIVGAGPSGLLLAILLAKNGIPVTLVEKSEKLDEQPRATHYGPPAMLELNRAGVGDDIRRLGFQPNGVSWRKLDGSVITKLSSEIFENDPTRIACLPLNRLGKVLSEHLKKYPQVDILFDHLVTGIGQDNEKAWVHANTPEGPKKIEADYIVGCDGANSQVRRSLFGDWEFPGKTWDRQIVATNVYYDFDQFKWDDSNFIVHPEHYFMAAKITNDGMWRVSYGELNNLTNDELLARQPAKFKAFLPGHPDPDKYKIANISPYKIHQRLAKKMRVGKFLLAADAAHLCNPFGGMGLTGGIVDIGNLADCLVGIYQKKADSSILDKYDEIRRQKYNEIVDPISSDNIRRLFDQDPDKALENDGFFKACKRCETDPEFAKEFQKGVMALQHDFTQYYK